MKKALLIGCDYEGTSNELKGCSNDVYMMRKLLSEMDYKTDLLCDDKERSLNDVKCVPTSKNIINEIEHFCSLDNLTNRFFHYSGHGSSIVDREGDEKDRRDEVIIPVDNTYISDDQLNQQFGKLPENAKACFLFDACHSGSILDLKYTMDSNGEDVLDNQRDHIKCDVIMISGCMDNQTSADAWIERDFRGAMTSSFLDTNKKYGMDITVKDFIGHMRTYLKSKGYPQIPQLSYSKPGACNNLMSCYLI